MSVERISPPFPDEELVNEYIAGLQWSGEQTDHEETLVVGNIRAFAAHLREICSQPDDQCEHGIVDGDWCPACNRAYKDAIIENGLGT